MEWLDLSTNDLEGSIPAALGGLENLKWLNLSYNELDGPILAELGGLVNLETLWLHLNNLEGPIPAELGGLVNLKWFSLRGNNLDGPIPAELDGLENLERLMLWDNELDGSIPAELGGLVNLESLWLSDNNLEGTIPAELGGLVNLETLWLNNNNLDGPIPAELGGLENLVTLWLSNNYLDGPIPAELGGLENLEELWLNNNYLEGPIPAELGGLVNLEELYLNGNAFEGEVPDSITNLTMLNPWNTDLGYNMLTATDAEVITFLEQKNQGWDQTQTVTPEHITVTQKTNSSVEVAWEPVAYTEDEGYYLVRYGTQADDLADSVVTNDKTVSSIEIGELEDQVDYYFAVQTRTKPHEHNTNTLTSPLSEIKGKKIEIMELDTPVLVSPENETDDVGLTPLFQWDESDRAEFYHLQLANDPDFTNALIDTTEIQQTKYQLSEELEKGVTYYWRVRAGDEAVYSDWSKPLSFTTIMPTDASANKEIPEAFVLMQNYPNPFNPSTQIRFAIPEQAHVTLSVYNLLGQQVGSVLNETRSAGWHDLTFDASGLSSGVFIYRIEAGGYVETRQMLFVK